MIRVFTTTDEQDAAITWRVEQMRVHGERITEDQLIAQFATTALTGIVAAFKDDEATRVFVAFKDASLDDRKAVKETLNL